MLYLIKHLSQSVLCMNPISYCYFNTLFSNNKFQRLLHLVLVILEVLACYFTDSLKILAEIILF